MSDNTRVEVKPPVGWERYLDYSAWKLRLPEYVKREMIDGAKRKAIAAALAEAKGIGKS